MKRENKIKSTVNDLDNTLDTNNFYFILFYFFDFILILFYFYFYFTLDDEKAHDTIVT